MASAIEGDGFIALPPQWLNDKHFRCRTAQDAKTDAGLCFGSAIPSNLNFVHFILSINVYSRKDNIPTQHDECCSGYPPRARLPAPQSPAAFPETWRFLGNTGVALLVVEMPRVVGKIMTKRKRVVTRVPQELAINSCFPASFSSQYKEFATRSSSEICFVVLKACIEELIGVGINGSKGFDVN
jgi:hypothetical protein